MTRRDLIIIATLLNAGLLAGLFMLAVNSDDDKLVDPVEINQTITEVKPLEGPQEVATLSSTPSTPIQEPSSAAIPSSTMNPNDEVDNALKELTKANTAQMVVIDDDAQDDDEESSPTEHTPPVTQPKPVVTPNQTPKEPQENPSKKTIEVTVKSGDSLDKIARANNTTINAIKELNQLKSDRLKIGQVLKVQPGEKKSKAASSEKKTEVAQGDVEYYTVKSGDNPWKIAKQFHIKVDDLLKLNNLDEEKARNMKIGDKIRVR